MVPDILADDAVMFVAEKVCRDGSKTQLIDLLSFSHDKNTTTTKKSNARMI